MGDLLVRWAYTFPYTKEILDSNVGIKLHHDIVWRLGVQICEPSSGGGPLGFQSIIQCK